MTLGQQLTIASNEFWYPTMGKSTLNADDYYAFGMCALQYHRHTGDRVPVQLGYRSDATQAVLYKAWLTYKQNGKPWAALAAAPGRSTHRLGDTLDWGMTSKFQNFLQAGNYAEKNFGLFWDGKDFNPQEGWHYRKHPGTKIKNSYVLSAKGHIEIGDYGPHVDKVKNHLEDLGHDVGDLKDGLWNQRCVNAVAKWSVNHKKLGLGTGGYFGVKKFYAMFPDFNQ